MTSPEAKKILMLFRPGSADESDAVFQEARQLAKADPELARWFGMHCETYSIVRQRIQSFPVPPGLKEQILSERKVNRTLFQKHGRALLAAAAVVALLAGLAFYGWPLRSLNNRYAAYRKRMTETALRNYYMDLVSKDPAQVRGFLKAGGAPSDYSLPPGLNSADLAGCAISHWQGHRVSLICFKSGRPLPPGDQSDLWLFVIAKKDAPGAPPSGAPLLARVNKATTASWTEDGNAYLLAAVGDEEFLRNYLY
ncbi:MAG TPA: hypothetical protein VGO59_12425 [Verrucomicrobiae bacterium]